MKVKEKPKGGRGTPEFPADNPRKIGFPAKESGGGGMSGKGPKFPSDNPRKIGWGKA